MKDNKLIKKEEWYNNPSIITTLLICLTMFIIILSQSFAINSEISGITMFSNILNYNISYMIVLLYFIFLKTKIGKKYFNFINLLLMVLYFIIFITSIFTVFQSFSLSSLLVLAVYAILFVYLFHTFLRRTVVWSEFRLEESPFNEFTNSWYFYSIVILAVTLLSVNFISITNFNGIILALLDCFYNILFARYIYLYREFISSFNNDKSDASINSIKETIDVVVKKVEEVSKDIEFDEKKEKVSEEISKDIDSFSEKARKVYNNLTKEDKRAKSFSKSKKVKKEENK